MNLNSTNGVPPSPVCYAELTVCPTCQNDMQRCVGADKVRPPEQRFGVPMSRCTYPACSGNLMHGDTCCRTPGVPEVPRG
jgi:hypothetical protein